MRKAVILLGIVLLLFACATSSALEFRRRPSRSVSTGLEERSITVGRWKRTFHIYVPGVYDRKKPIPVILAFHGGMGTGETMAESTQFHRLAAREAFIVVYPDGYKRNWADGRGTTDAEKAGVNDVEFVRVLIHQLTKEFSIDDARIYATGLSNGAIFAYRLACELPEPLAAIAAVAGQITPSVASRCNPTRPISVLGIYGTKDPLSPWGGGEGTRGAGGEVLGVRATIDLWRKLNNCRQSQEREALPVRVHDGTHVWREVYTQCDGGAEVVLYGVEGMGHGWPPRGSRVERIGGPTSGNIDATEVIWNFFERRRARTS